MIACAALFKTGHRQKFLLVLMTSVFLSAASLREVMAATPSSSSGEAMAQKMKVKVGSRVFTATLIENNTVKAFKALLPMTLEMPDLNGNEKHIDLGKSLATDSSKPKNIQIGDIMIYGSKTLVLFYKSFPTPYSYTMLGKIDDASGLLTALGGGTATVTFEIE